MNNYEKTIFVIDMNNGFVNFGAMANPKYNALVPEQLDAIEMVRNDNGLVNFILKGHNDDALEFKTYPKHCVLGTKEAELIPEFKNEQYKEDTRVYYKNSINGMLNIQLLNDLKNMTNLKEIIIVGVCADLCVMDFARTLSRYLDQLNLDVNIHVIESAIDTFDAPGHNRDEWLKISKMVMQQAGIDVVPNLEILKDKLQGKKTIR